ncbi:class IIb bacteriocin, lactobin A/cerein 7B family [Flavobacterium psychrophilum]|nr:class IIb bacteriocin, lactobin A/cerein 7B family [Flavobacterium psychrophilum]
MMNLENLNLVELNAQEMQEVEGGFVIEFLLGALVAYIIHEITKP